MHYNICMLIQYLVLACVFYTICLWWYRFYGIYFTVTKIVVTKLGSLAKMHLLTVCFLVYQWEVVRTYCMPGSRSCQTDYIFIYEGKIKGNNSIL